MCLPCSGLSVCELFSGLSVRVKRSIHLWDNGEIVLCDCVTQLCVIMKHLCH